MKMKRLVLAVFAAALPSLLSAQTLDNSSLTGRYGVVHYWVDVDANGFGNSARNLGGVMVFDGNGGYSFQGQLGVGAAPGSAVSGSGSYTVSSNGFLTLSNPIDETVMMNARVGDQADVLLGSSTEGPVAVYDLFVAVRLAAEGPGNALLSGNYTAASLWLPNGSDVQAKTALVSMSADGQGGFGSMSADGHAADQGDAPLLEPIAGSSYSVAADGTGALSVGSGSTLFQGPKTIYVSTTGNYVLGHSTASGVRDVFVAIRNLSGGVTNGSLSGGYWVADLFADLGGSFYNAAVGALNSNGAGTVSLAQRLKIADTLLDFSGVNSYGLAANANGFMRGLPAPNLTNFAAGAGGGRPALSEQGVEQAAAANGFVQAELFQTEAVYRVHGISVGVRMPLLSGSDVFLSPLGVVNAASFAPPTHPISGGAMLSLFGTGLADSTAAPSVTPLPTQLNGVSVTINGIAAPLFFVSAGQINLQTPFAVQGQTADIIVTNNGQSSPPVQVPVAPTSPGIFSLQQTGFGPGIVTHADFSLVTAQNPARLGEVVIIFLTGMGAVNPSFPDGAAGPVNPLSRTTDPNISVLFGGETGTVFFSGAAPGFVGLYQLNARIPSTGVTGSVPVAIQTSNAFTDFVDIEVVP